MDEARAIDREIDALRARHAELTAAVEQDDIDLAAADVALGLDQRIYDAAGAAVADAMAATIQPFGTERSRRPGELEDLQAARREAEATHQQADEALGESMVARNQAAQRRGDRLMAARRLEQEIAQAERVRDRLAAQAEGNRKPLERLRRTVAARLGGRSLMRRPTTRATATTPGLRVGGVGRSSARRRVNRQRSATLLAVYAPVGRRGGGSQRPRRPSHE